MAGYTEQEATTERNLIDGGELVAVGSQHDNAIWHGRIEAGYQARNGFTPFVALGGMKIEQDAFAEAGSALALVANKQANTLTFADAGVRYTYKGARSSYGFDASVRRIVDGAKPEFTAAFAGLESVTFDIKGQPLAKEALRIGGHYTYGLTDKTVIFADLGGDWSNNQGRNYYGTTGLRLAF